MKFDAGRCHGAYQKLEPEEDQPLPERLEDFLVALRARTGNSDDVVVQYHTVAGCALAVVMFEGQVSNQQVSQLLLGPLGRLAPEEAQDSAGVLKWLRDGTLLASDQKEARTMNEVLTLAMSGFAVVVVDGQKTAVALGYQGFMTRGVGEPSSEVNLRGSREGFCEVINYNVALVRRRLKSGLLTVESMDTGTVSRTKIKILYLRGAVSSSLIQAVRKKLAQVDISVVLDSAYLQPFLDRGRFSFFSGTGSTERPDVLCAKLAEGRIGVLVDGTPFALIVPFLFAEHFQTMDDYTHRPYFATFLRLLRMAAFFVTVFLPGYYVAMVTYHPDLIPDLLLSSLIGSVLYTPLPAFWEAVLVFLLYELLREAGLRLPRPIGHAVSIVGGLVIGDAAVSAGLVGLPMVILIALTAVTSFVVPSLYQPVTILRLLFLFAGGMLGLFGIYLGLGIFLVDLCSLQTLGIPVTAPAAPLDTRSMRDLLVRAGWKKLEQSDLRVDDVPGAEKRAGDDCVGGGPVL